MEIKHSPLKSSGTEVYFCAVLPWGVVLVEAYENHTSLVGAPGPLVGPAGSVLLEALGQWGSFGTSGLLTPWVEFGPSVLPLAGLTAPLFGLLSLPASCAPSVD